MYVHPFPVPVGGSLTIPIPTRGTDGAAVTGNTLADGDFAVHINGSTTAATIAAGATTPSSDFASATGRNQLVIDTSQDSDFAAGAYCHVWLTKTIDSVAIQECVGVFFMETATQLAVRRLQESLYSGGHLVGATGNDSTHVHLAGLDASIGDDEINGEMLLLFDVDTTEPHFAIVTDFANSGDLATVQNIYDGGVLPFTPAQNDYWFRLGPAPLRPTIAGRNLDVSSGGEAGMDLANVGSPTTTLNLSGTTISTSQAVASVSGAVGSVTGAVGSVTGAVGSVTAGVTLANDAITSAKFDESTAFPLRSNALNLSAAGIITGTAATGTLSTTVATSNLTGYADDQLIGRIIIFTSGPADGEATEITDYAETNGQITFTALTTAPENGNTFCIL